jgi:hypothetical protein
MSYRKFALVPYKDYQLMTDHKCVKNDSDTTMVVDTHTHKTPINGVDTPHNKAEDKVEHVQTEPVTPQVTEHAQQVAVSSAQLPNPPLYKQASGTTKGIASSKKRKSAISNTDNNKPSKVYNTKKKKSAVTSKSGNFTWLGM